MVMKPNEALTSMSRFFRISLIVSQICRKSFSGGALYAQTIQKLFAPFFNAFSACSNIFSGGSNGYFSMIVLLKEDWAQNEQSSGHVPDFALIKVSTSI